MLIVETTETVATKRVYTPCNVQGVIFVPVPEKQNGHFGATLGLKKYILYSHPEMLLRLENYESVDDRLCFPGIKMRLKISFHRH